MIAFILIGVLFLTSFMTPARGDDCAEKACVNVYTQDNQIIIEAKRGTTTAKKTISQAPKKPTVKPKPKPTKINYAQLASGKAVDGSKIPCVN